MELQAGATKKAISQIKLPPSRLLRLSLFEFGFIKIPQQSRTDKARLSLAIEMNDALALQYEIPLTTVDAVIEKNSVSSVAVLKIDVEGFEASVLRGASKHLKLVKNIVFEALTDHS